MYLSPKNHNPRTSPSGARMRPAPSQSGNRGVTVYGVPDPRGAGSSLPSNTPWQKPPPRKPFSPRVVTGDQTGRRIKDAVEKAFPYGKNTPRWGGLPSRAASATAGQYAQGADAAYEAATAAWEGYRATQEALKPDGWHQQQPVPGTSGPNPGLVNIGTRTHSEKFGNNFPRAFRQGEWISGYNFVTMGGQQFLQARRPRTDPQIPNGFHGETLPSNAEVPAGMYWFRMIEDYWYEATAFDHKWSAKVEGYYNAETYPQPVWVTQPGGYPIPAGVPLPIGVPEGYPMVSPDPYAQPKTRPLPRPRSYEEVAIQFRPPPRPGARPGLVVFPARPRPPGPNGKETKSYGKAQAAASWAFWSYEATEDVADWVNIVVQAIPDAPNWVKGAGPVQQMVWLMQNPAAVATANWAEAAWAFGQWAIDEAFGAMVGEINKRANRGISTGGSFTIDMRTNVVQHYGQAGSSSPGAFAIEYIRAFT